FNFDRGKAEDNDSIWTAIEHDQVTTIKGIISADHLQVFTDQGEFYAPSSDTKPLTPTSIQFRNQSPNGIATVKPIKLDSATFFVQKTGKNVREFLFSEVSQKYNADSVSLLSPHLLKDPVDFEAFYGDQDYPEQYAFLVNGDG